MKITMISNVGIDSEVDVDVESFGFVKAEELIADLISQGFEIDC